jgi:hypothetical protein
LLAALKELLPYILFATTLNVYAVVGDKPEIVTGEEVPVAVKPPEDAITV